MYDQTKRAWVQRRRHIPIGLPTHISPARAWRMRIVWFDVWFSTRDGRPVLNTIAELPSGELFRECYSDGWINPFILKKVQR
jgi:hypothetical protein